MHNADKPSDMKHGLTSSKPKLSIIGRRSMNYQTRGMEYGDDKYARGNYYNAPPAGVSRVERFMGYVDAAMRHLTDIALAYNYAKGTGGDVGAACSIIDDEINGEFPPSMLPHIALAAASMMVGIEVAVMDGILQADPGQPWKKHPLYQTVLEKRGLKVIDIPQKYDTEAERDRVQRLHADREEFENEFAAHEKRLKDARVASGAYDVLDALGTQPHTAEQELLAEIVR